MTANKYFSMDSIFSNLDKPKTELEYKYMFENSYIYTQSELKIVLSSFLKYFNFEIYPDLIESYNSAYKTLL